MNAESQHGECPHDRQEDATKHGKHDVASLQAKVGWVRVLSKREIFDGQCILDASVPVKAGKEDGPECGICTFLKGDNSRMLVEFGLREIVTGHLGGHHNGISLLEGGNSVDIGALASDSSLEASGEGAVKIRGGNAAVFVVLVDDGRLVVEEDVDEDRFIILRNSVVCHIADAKVRVIKICKVRIVSILDKGSNGLEEAFLSSAVEVGEDGILQEDAPVEGAYRVHIATLCGGLRKVPAELSRIKTIEMSPSKFTCN